MWGLWGRIGRGCRSIEDSRRIGKSIALIIPFLLARTPNRTALALHRRHERVDKLLARLKDRARHGSRFRRVTTGIFRRFSVKCPAILDFSAWAAAVSPSKPLNL